MCLFTKNKEVLTADEDMTCYKIVYVDKKGTKSYFQNSPIIYGKLYKKPGNGFRFYIVKGCNLTGYWVEEGGYHLFTTLDDALCYFEYMPLSKDELTSKEGALFSINSGARVKIVKAVIPKGTKYVEGTFNGHPMKNICTKAVIYEEF